jgi:GGDEF domain-containing protein
MATFDVGASQLLSAADAAMYRAKTAGANRIEF